ncbi:MAG: cytochrome c maturation protein CcmE, partial [Acidobacteria bacterium]|nr:cytochrome c maturation protein CcmE [Acidobacteriota bacterium]
MGSAHLKFILGGIIVLVALGWLGFVGFQESKSYYITVDEYAAMKNDLQGKSLKIAGDVVEGSIDRSKPQMEFVISHHGQDLKVRYVGRAVVPDTFKGGAKAVVEGTVSDDGVLLARHIEAKCASKY